MAHHKRRRAKQQRPGCLLCKPHKRTVVKKGERSRRVASRMALRHQTTAG